MLLNYCVDPVVVSDGDLDTLDKLFGEEIDKTIAETKEQHDPHRR